MKISHLYIYPVKSLGGISLSESIVKRRGLQYDRRWMLVDLEGKFISQRSHPIMALLSTEISDHTLCIKYIKDLENKIIIPLNGEGAQDPMEVEVWGTQCEGLAYLDEINQWFVQLLGVPCKLVYMPDHSERVIKSKYQLNKKIVSFADSAPYLVIGQSSLDELNKRLAEPVLMDRFRPNIVFIGGQAHNEDEWSTFQIGEVPFKGYKLCARCNMTTIDQSTGNVGKEPLKTLAAYRRWDNKIFFGQNAVWLDEDSPKNEVIKIKVGDEIRV